MRRDPPPNNSTFLELPIRGEIGDAMADEICGRLRSSPKANTIWMTVNSHGGDERCMWRIYNAIRAHPAKKKISSGVGQVCSAAATIFMAGDVRRIYPTATLLLHSIEQEPRTFGRWTADAHEASAKTLRILDQKVAKELAARCGVPVNVIAAELENEKEMPLVKALSIGLVHEVVGDTHPLSKDWPEQAARYVKANSPRIFGSNRYLFSDSYLNACRIGGK